MRKPKGNGPFPVLVHFHGAPGGRGMEQLVGWARGDHGGPVFERFLQEGYVIVIADYRAVNFATLADPPPADAVTYADDAVAVIEHVRKLPFVDANRIHVYGVSLGGDVTMHLLARTSVRVGDPRRGRADPLPRRQAQPERAARGSVPRHDRRRSARDGEHREGHHADPDPGRDRRLAAADQPAAARSPREGRQEGAHGGLRGRVSRLRDGPAGPEPARPARAASALLDITLQALESAVKFVKQPTTP